MLTLNAQEMDRRVKVLNFKDTLDVRVILSTIWRYCTVYKP